MSQHDHSQQMSVQQSEHSSSQQFVFKNVQAFWEHEMREGVFLPDYTSKFVNMPTLLLIKEGKIFKIMQHQVIFKVCMTPPVKQVLVKKMEAYLKPHGIASGIDHSK